MAKPMLGWTKAAQVPSDSKGAPDMNEELQGWYFEVKPKEVEQKMGYILRHYEEYLSILRAHIEQLEKLISIQDGNAEIRIEGASITLRRGGAIIVKANDIVIEAIGNVEIKAGRSLVTKAAKIVQS
jgi:hypothetical protein